MCVGTDFFYTLLVAHNPHYKVGITGVGIPTHTNEIVCDTTCVSCTYIVPDWTTPFCVNVPYNQEGSTPCLGHTHCCDFWCNHEELDSCVTVCHTHQFLTTNATLHDVFRSHVVYKHDGGYTKDVENIGNGSAENNTHCVLPKRINPPFYTLTPTLFSVLIVSVTLIVMGIIVDIVYTIALPYFFPVVTITFVVVWMLASGITSIIVYMP